MSLKKHYGPNLRLAFPVMAANAGQMIVGIADTIMVGQYDSSALSASAFSNSILANFLVLGIGFSTGLTPLVGQANGRGEGSKVLGTYLKQGLILNLVLGLTLVLGVLALYPYLGLLGQTTKVVELSQAYYLVVGASLLPFMGFFALKQFAEGLEQTRQATALTLMANVLNIGLNYLLIYGYAGFPEWGLFGAGLATLISRIFLFGAFALYLMWSPSWSVYWRGWLLPFWSWSDIRAMLRLGFPIALQLFMEVGAFTFGALMVGWVSEKALAAHQVAMSMASFTYMIANGMAAATTIRVSNFYGRKDYLALRQASYAALWLALGFMAICAVAFVLIPEVLAGFFTQDVEVIDLAISLLLIGALFQLFDGGQVVMLGALRGLSDVRVPTLIAVFSYWVISLPVGYWLSVHGDWGARGVWLGYLAGLSFAVLFLLWRFDYLSRRLALAGAKGGELKQESEAREMV